MQTWALLVDSYRLLLSRKLFWITLVISAVVVLLYASIGFDDNGWFIFFGAFPFESDLFKAGSEWSKGLYLGLFSYFIVGFWLTWAAAILALVSTTPIFNDFMANGSIDLVLSKPVSRAWVFFVKYLGSLLFVVLQVSLFAVGVFLCVGWRIGEWNWSIFWSIPVVTIFFSYLYGFSVLMTMITRSTMASLLLTMLFWVVIFAVDRAERVLNQLRIQSEVTAEFLTVESMSGRHSGYFEEISPEKVREPSSKAAQKRLEEQRRRREEERRRLEQQVKRRKESLKEDAASFAQWRNVVGFIQAFLPKTKQTTDLLDEWMMEGEYSMDAILSGQPQRQQRANREDRSGGRRNPQDQFSEIQRRTMEDYASRSDSYILGTSLAFEAIVLALACFLFYRRDF